jgi:DNA-binding MarR family transcriptional regulator
VNKKYEMLNFKKTKKDQKLHGHFTRLSNYIVDALNLADISFSEYKLYMFFYRRTIGNSQRVMDLEYLREMAESAGMSYSSFYRAMKSLQHKKMITIEPRTFRRFDKDIEVETVKIETFPDKWVGVGDNVRFYIDKWIKNRKQDMGYFKSGKSGTGGTIREKK